MSNANQPYLKEFKLNFNKKKKLLLATNYMQICYNWWIQNSILYRQYLKKKLWMQKHRNKKGWFQIPSLGHTKDASLLICLESFKFIHTNGIKFVCRHIMQFGTIPFPILSVFHFYTVWSFKNCLYQSMNIFNRPRVAGAFLLTALSFIHSFIKWWFVKISLRRRQVQRLEMVLLVMK